MGDVGTGVRGWGPVERRPEKMERLSGLDASFLYLESPSNHMHVAATMTFDPSTVEGGYSFEKVRANYE